MIWFIAGLILLAVLLMVMRWLAQADPDTVKKTVKSVIFFACGGFLLLLFWRWKQILFPLFGLFRSRAEQPYSTIRTDTLEMHSGPGGVLRDGTVLAGGFVGQSLSRLSLSNLQTLFAYCQGYDCRSAVILETYLNQRFGHQWHHRSRGKTHHGPDSADITRSQAYHILGLDSQANKADIITAHRRLIRQLHPDRNGGDDRAAARVNRARDILLGRG